MFCVRKTGLLRMCASQASRSLNSRERFLKGEAVNSSQYGPLKDGPDVTIVSSKTGGVPDSAPLSRRKQEHVDKEWAIQEKIEEYLDLMNEVSQMNQSEDKGKPAESLSQESENIS